MQRPNVYDALRVYRYRTRALLTVHTVCICVRLWQCFGVPHRRNLPLNPDLGTLYATSFIRTREHVARRAHVE